MARQHGKGPSDCPVKTVLRIFLRKTASALRSNVVLGSGDLAGMRIADTGGKRMIPLDPLAGAEFAAVFPPVRAAASISSPRWPIISRARHDRSSDRTRPASRRGSARRSLFEAQPNRRRFRRLGRRRLRTTSAGTHHDCSPSGERPARSLLPRLSRPAGTAFRGKPHPPARPTGFADRAYSPTS